MSGCQLPCCGGRRLSRLPRGPPVCRGREPSLPWRSGWCALAKMSEGKARPELCSISKAADAASSLALGRRGGRVRVRVGGRAGGRACSLAGMGRSPLNSADASSPEARYGGMNTGSSSGGSSSLHIQVAGHSFGQSIGIQGTEQLEGQEARHPDAQEDISHLRACKVRLNEA